MTLISQPMVLGVGVEVRGGCPKRLFFVFQKMSIYLIPITARCKGFIIIINPTYTDEEIIGIVK